MSSVAVATPLIAADGPFLSNFVEKAVPPLFRKIDGRPFVIRHASSESLFSIKQSTGSSGAQKVSYILSSLSFLCI